MMSPKLAKPTRNGSELSASSRRRIAVVSHSHPSLSKGGAEIAAHTLFTGLIALGVDAIFISACSEGDRARLTLGSGREYAVFYEPRLYDYLYHLASPSVVAQLYEIIREQKIDVVNFHHFLHYGIGAIRGLVAESKVQTFVTLHEFLPICHHHGQMITRPAFMLCERSSPLACSTCFPEHSRQQFALRRDLFHSTFANVRGFISPSSFLAGRFVEWGLDPGRIAVIENGLAHLPASSSMRPSRDTGPWVFGFFGQINPFKGVDTILDAVDLIARDRSLAQRIQIRLHGNIIGQSEQFVARLRSVVDKREFISHAGPYDNTMVARLMAECDYVLVPSSWWENSPVVIQEAYAVGCPVICTGIGGMAEKVTDGVSGLHFRLGDHSDLVRVLDTAANSDTFADLRKGVPRPGSAIEMAKAYLAAFDRFGLHSERRLQFATAPGIG